MRRIAQVRTCKSLAAVAVLVCSVSAFAAEQNRAVSRAAQQERRSHVGVIRPVSSDLDIDVNTAYRSEIKKRYADQDLKMAKAVKLVEQQKFHEGVTLAKAVRDEIKLEAEHVKGEIIASRLAEAEALVSRLSLAWGRYHIRAAREAFWNNRLEDAESNIAEVIRVAPELHEEVDALRKLRQGKQRSDDFQNSASISVANPHLNNLRNETRTLLAEAKVFFENKRYLKALDKVEQVYLRDPFNLEAVALAGDIYRIIFTAGYYRHRSDFELQSAYTTWQWIEPVFEAPETPKEINSEVKTDSRKLMSDKLRTTILPSYKYARSDARGAVKTLKALLEKQKLDIDIIDGTGPEDSAVLGQVGLDLKNVSVADVLRYISLMSGLKYRVEHNVVHIGTSVETMYDRTYEIQPHVRNMVYTSTSTDVGNEDGGDLSTNASIFRKKGAKGEKKAREDKRLERDKTPDEELKLTEIADIEVTSPMFKEYLMKHGIRFGEGSTVTFLQDSSTLVVKNTLDNLDAISQLIREQNELQAPLILVEVKCIEISDNDMEELGFDWSLGDTNLNNNMTNEGSVINPNKGGWMFGPGNSTRKTDQGERGSMNPIRTGFMDGSSSVGLINNLNIFPMLFGSKTPFGSDVPINISLTVNALSQNTRTEVVSAPKVVALSGVRASAKMTKSYYFPDSWSDLEVDTDTGDNDTSYTITRPTPEFGDEQEIGIDMKVTPTVTETGAINLDLDFEVTGTNGNDEFTFVLNGNVNGRPVSHSFTVWKPVITERQVLTNIDVYDGQTVVVGGSTDNRTVTRSDKIPFLGELPFIGRLFQAQSEKAERRNMLIFVTARKLGTDGAATQSRNQGIPDFNR